jgi:hypothetical protein
MPSPPIPLPIEEKFEKEQKKKVEILKENEEKEQYMETGR